MRGAASTQGALSSATLSAYSPAPAQQLMQSWEKTSPVARCCSCRGSRVLTAFSRNGVNTSGTAAAGALPHFCFPRLFLFAQGPEGRREASEMVVGHGVNVRRQVRGPESA